MNEKISYALIIISLFFLHSISYANGNIGFYNKGEIILNTGAKYSGNIAFELLSDDKIKIISINNKVKIFPVLFCEDSFIKINSNIVFLSLLLRQWIYKYNV